MEIREVGFVIVKSTVIGDVHAVLVMSIERRKRFGQETALLLKCYWLSPYHVYSLCTGADRTFGVSYTSLPQHADLTKDLS